MAAIPAPAGTARREALVETSSSTTRTVSPAAAPSSIPAPRLAAPAGPPFVNSASITPRAKSIDQTVTLGRYLGASPLGPTWENAQGDGRGSLWVTGIPGAGGLPNGNVTGLRHR